MIYPCATFLSIYVFKVENKLNCPSVCVSVCSQLRYRLNVVLPPLPKVGYPIFLDIWNPWGKSNGKKWSQIWTFLFGSGVKLPTKLNFFKMILPYKTRWKQRFPMDWRPLVKGRMANFGIALNVFRFLCFRWFFFRFFKQFGFWGILGPPGIHASQWIRDLWSKGLSLILSYF